MYKYEVMKKFLIPLLAIGLIGGASCNQGQGTNSEPLVNSVDKNSAREVQLSTVEAGDTVFHIVKQKIWVKGKLIADVSDTIKTPLNQESQDWEPSEKVDKNELVKIPIYVTVQ